MEQQSKERHARRLSLLFVATAAVIIVGIITCILMMPYDPGVLIGTSLSGNNQYGGQISSSNDYLFYTADHAIMRQDFSTDKTTSVYTGQVSHLNPYDGWLYFVEQGTIKRTGYHGGKPMVLGSHTNVISMSVNGLWLYYLTDDGRLHKIRSDGEKQSTITDGTIRFTAFESANRIILTTDGKNIYRMQTDGNQCDVLVKGKQITRMLYTLDRLFYCDNGVVQQIPSVEAGADDGTTYQPVKATIFNYNINTENRGMLYYVKGNELRVSKLQSIQHDKTEDVLLTKADNVTDLYSIGQDLYYHDDQGQLFFVRINDAECTVEKVG